MQRDIHHNLSGGSSYDVPYLSLRPATYFDKNNLLTSWGSNFIPQDISTLSEHKEVMLAELDWLITNMKYNGTDIDKQRIAYLKEHGVQVYGASVTGPVRELEKLQEQPEFTNFHLGRIEVWNWE